MYTFNEFRPLVYGSTYERGRVILMFIMCLSFGAFAVSAIFELWDIILSYSAKVLPGFAMDTSLYATLSIANHAWVNWYLLVCSVIVAIFAMTFDGA